MTAPKHRANKLVRTEPRVQPAGRHVDSIVTRLGATVLDLEEMLGIFRVPEHIREMGRTLPPELVDRGASS